MPKLEEKKLAPNPPADKITLIRRATLDLIGLPPSTEEVQAFLADNSPAAFEKVVDRLLLPSSDLPQKRAAVRKLGAAELQKPV